MSEDEDYSWNCDNCGDFIIDEAPKSFENKYNQTLIVCKSCWRQLRG